MLLTAEDLDTATDAILRFLACWHREPIPKITREALTTPSGKCLEIVVYLQRGQSQPDTAWLGFSEQTEKRAALEGEAPYRLFFQPPNPETGVETGIFVRTEPTGVRAEYQAVSWQRDKEGVKRRREDEGLHFHVLLPGGQVPFPRDSRHRQFPICPVCRKAFCPAGPEQRFCCGKCAEGRPKQSRHDDTCDRIFPKPRRFRRLRGADWVPWGPLSPTAHLIDGSESRPGVFLQLAVYAARAKRLTSEAENEVVGRFKKRFHKSAQFRLRQHGGQPDEEEELLNDVWMTVRKNYRLPTHSRAFSSYVSRIIQGHAHPQYGPPVVPPGSEWDNEAVSAEL